MNRLLSMGLAAFVALLCIAIAAPVSADTLPPYAPVKTDTKDIKPREQLGQFFAPLGPLPQHGVMIVLGSFISPGGGFFIVDFDNHKISQTNTITQSLPDGTSELVVTGKSERGLNDEELKPLLEKANDVWNPPPPSTPSGPMHMPPMDSYCALYLLDGDQYLEKITCSPHDLVDQIEHIKINK